MNNIKFVKVLKLDQKNLDTERKVINVTEENITKLNQNNFLIKMLAVYREKEFDENEFITEIIKCNLSTDEEEAYTQWFNGIEYNGDKYVAWFSTTGGMKQDKNGICDTFFIKEDCQKFIDILERLVSLGKFQELEKLKDDDKNKKICINKDVLSRLSLITSDLITEIQMPNFIVLPQATYHIVKDYKTVQPYTYIEKKERELKDGTIKVKEIEHIDYNLVDYHFDTNKTNEKGEKIDKLDIFDGGGIATPKIFESIGKSLNRDDIEFAIIRGYGLAIKGLITKFDILGYLDLAYKKDTDFCKKENDKYYLKDMWNEWQEVTNNTMLLNESMVKLAKYYKNMNEYLLKMDKLNNPKYRKYGTLLNKLYITKVNKKDEEIKDYRRSNYQLINSLALTPKAYSKLTKQDRKLFKKILKPYDCITNIEDKEKIKEEKKEQTLQFKENIDYINLFYKKCVSDNIQELDENYEDVINENCKNVVDKVSELIDINPKFVNLNYVKQNLRKLIEKKVRELACGKVTIKAKYQYIAIDPISYMNWAMTREQGSNGLNEGQFYSGDCQNNDIRTIQRCPQSSYSEVHNINFIRNELLDEWLCKSKEIIYFNQKSDILSLLSSADCDGDAVTVIDEPIIADAVVTPKDGKYFITKLDGDKKTLIYNPENRFISTYRASGNLIGGIALKAVGVNNNSQVIPSYWDRVNNKFVDKNTLVVDLKMDEDMTDEQVKEYFKENIDNGRFIGSWEVDDKLKEFIKNKFYENEKEIYICLYNSMSAIDVPKTLSKLPKKYMEIIDKKYHKQANFLKYRKNKDDVNIDSYFCRGKNLLDRFTKRIQEEFLDIIEGNENNQARFTDNHKLLQKCFDNEEYSKEIYELVNPKIEELYKKYNKEREEAGKECRSANKKLWDYKKYMEEEVQSWGSFEENEHYERLRANKQKKYDKYKEIDKKYIPVAQEIIKDFDMATVCKSISDLKNCRENFILSLFFKCFKYVSKKDDNIRYQYQKCKDGDIEYLYEKYKRTTVKGFDNSEVIEKIDTEDKIRMNLEAKIRFRMNDSSIIEEIKQVIESGKTYELNLQDERVQAFDEFIDIVKDKDTLKIIKFDTKKNGELEIAKKSFGVVIEL